MSANKDRAQMLKIKQSRGVEPEEKKEIKGPTTVKGKISNFLFHYKIHLIFFLVMVIFLGIFISDMVTRVDYDQSIIILSSSFITDVETEKIKGYFQSFVKDVNNNGRVEVSVAPIYLSGEANENAEMEMASQMKIIAELSSNTTFLYIFDDFNYEKIFSHQDIFVKTGEKDRMNLENTELSRYFFENNNYYLGLRVPEGINLKKEKDQARYDEAVRIKELLEKE